MFMPIKVYNQKASRIFFCFKTWPSLHFLDKSWILCPIIFQQHAGFSKQKYYPWVFSRYIHASQFFYYWRSGWDWEKKKTNSLKYYNDLSLKRILWRIQCCSDIHWNIIWLSFYPLLSLVGGNSLSSAFANMKYHV